MQNAAPTSPPSAAEVERMSAGQVIALVQSQDANIEALKQQVDTLTRRLEWFTRRVFGSKSERFVAQPDPAPAASGEVFPAPEQIAEQRKAVPAHTRRVARDSASEAADAMPFFDELRVPVQVGSRQAISSLQAIVTKTGFEPATPGPGEAANIFVYMRMFHR